MSQIGMNEIPFAPVLGDTIPPTQKPRDPLPTKRPVAHTVIAWRNDGGLDWTRFETLETARDYAAALSYILHYKWCIMAGTRDFVARGDIVMTAKDIEAQKRFAAWHANGAR